MFEKFTDRARKLMALANQEAQRFNHEVVAPEHMLLAIVRDTQPSVAISVLKNLGVDPRKVRLEVEKAVKSGPGLITMGMLPLAPRAKLVIESAEKELSNLQHKYIGTEHILLGLMAVMDTVPHAVLCGALGLNLEEVREEMRIFTGVTVATNDEGLEVLAKKMYEIWRVSPSPMECASKCARVARDHYAMTAEKRQAIIDAMFNDSAMIFGRVAINREQWETSLVRCGAIPPRPEPTIEDILSKRGWETGDLNNLLGPVIDIVRRVAASHPSDKMKREAVEALKGLEKLGGE